MKVHRIAGEASPLGAGLLEPGKRVTDAAQQLERSTALRDAVAAERHLIADAGKTADHLTDAGMLDAVVNIGRRLLEVDPELDRWQSLGIAFVGFVQSLPDARGSG